MRDLSRWLLEDGLVTEPELAQAERMQQENGIPLSMALIELELVGEREIVELVARRHGIPKAPRKLYKMTVPAKALSMIPQDHCWQLGLFPFGIDLPSKTLKVAILDPSDQEALTLLRRLPGGLEADLYVAGPKQLEKAIRKHFLDSIVEDTNAPGLRFFGYENITSPGVSPGGNEGTESLDDIVLAEPDKTPRASAPAPEPALDRAARAVAPDEIPLPPSKPRTTEMLPRAPDATRTAPHASVTKRRDEAAPRPPTGETPVVRAKPLIPPEQPPATDEVRRSQLTIGRVSPASDERVVELERRVDGLERAMLDLLELFARSSLDLSDRAERIAGELGRNR